MLRIFEVTKYINNKVFSSASVGEFLYAKEKGLYNAYNKRICDLDSKTQKEYTIEIKPRNKNIVD